MDHDGCRRRTFERAGRVGRARSSLDELAWRLDAARKARIDDLRLPVVGATISGLSDCSALIHDAQLCWSFADSLLAQGDFVGAEDLLQFGQVYVAEAQSCLDALSAQAGTLRSALTTAWWWGQR